MYIYIYIRETQDTRMLLERRIEREEIRDRPVEAIATRNVAWAVERRKERKEERKKEVEGGGEARHEEAISWTGGEAGSG